MRDLIPDAVDFSDLEALLDATLLRHGNILLYVDRGEWTATVSHYNVHLTHPLGKTFAVPSEALKRALIEDERKSRDLERRYKQSDKLGKFLTVSDDDMIG